MLHKMNLNPGPFELIADGRKDIELRLNDEKRRAISVGDIIEFTNTSTGKLILTVVLGKYVFDNFENLYLHFDKIRIGYAEDEIASPDDMKAYYSEEKINQHGVVAIHVALIDALTPAMLVDSGICPTCFDKAHGRILYGEPGERLLYEDDTIECFLVGNPRADGHVAISSKEHYKDMTEIPDRLCEHVFTFARRMMCILKSVYRSESVYLCTMCDGPMNHFHIQLIPRYGFEKRGSSNFVKPRKAYAMDMEKIEKIRKLIDFYRS